MPAPKLVPLPLPGAPLIPLPPELRAWCAQRTGNAVRIIPTGCVVLCRADGLHRTYPTVAAACAAVG